MFNFKKIVSDKTKRESMPLDAEAIKIDQAAVNPDLKPDSEPAIDENPAHEQLQNKVNNLLLVNELSQQITSSLSLDDSFKQLYFTINSMMDASVAELVVLSENGDRKFYSNQNYNSNAEVLPFHNHFTNWCLKNQKEVHLENVEQDFGRYEFKPLNMPDGKKAGSLMCFPVWYQNKLVGALSVISFKTSAFESFHYEIIRLILPYIGVAIQNAATHQQILDLKYKAERNENFMQIFLANMSHEIRTPMNAVVGMTNLLLQKNPQNDQIKYLNAIQRSSENLLVILNDILDLSKIEAGKLEIETISFSVSELVKTAFELLQFKAQEKGLTLDLIEDNSIKPFYFGDPTRLNQVLVNLIGNAIKFTEKGKVSLKISLENHDASKPSEVELIKFEVIDTGIGLSAAQIKSLFKEYTQASTDTSRKFGGTGLGLSISKQLIQLMGGTINVDSKEGLGSNFYFTLPFKPNAIHANTGLKQNNTPEISQKLSGLKILIADDNEFNRIVIRETLELNCHGVEITETVNGLQVLELLKTEAFDLILMDILMPELDGLEATKTIRKTLASPIRNIPIIAMTASVLQSDIENCQKAGMNGFIPKPFRTEEMIQVLYKVLNAETAFTSSKVSDKTESIAKPLIDGEFVSYISEGDEERAQKYRELFLSKIPELLSNLSAAIELNDAAKIQLAAHSMKSVLKFNGVLRGYELAETIESLTQSHLPQPKLTELAQELSMICMQVMRILSSK